MLRAVLGATARSCRRFSCDRAIAESCEQGWERGLGDRLAVTAARARSRLCSGGEVGAHQASTQLVELVAVQATRAQPGAAAVVAVEVLEHARERVGMRHAGGEGNQLEAVGEPQRFGELGSAVASTSLVAV
jgi:hypothetical protein